MPIKEWAARIVSMMGDRDPGVVLTVTALVTTMAQAEIEAFSGSYQKAVDILDRVGDVPNRGLAVSDICSDCL